MKNCDECACGNCTKTKCIDRCNAKGIKCIREGNETKEQMQKALDTGKGIDLWGTCNNCSNIEYRGF